MGKRTAILKPQKCSFLWLLNYMGTEEQWTLKLNTYLELFFNSFHGYSWDCLVFSELCFHTRRRATTPPTDSDIYVGSPFWDGPFPKSPSLLFSIFSLCSLHFPAMPPPLPAPSSCCAFNINYQPLERIIFLVLSIEIGDTETIVLAATFLRPVFQNVFQNSFFPFIELYMTSLPQILYKINSKFPSL